MSDDDLEFAPEKELRYRHFTTKFEAEHPYALPLLKGHLLCEELLGEIIMSVCKQEKFLEKARLSFANKLHLARAIIGVDSSVWSSLELLNAARNGLAHGVVPDELEERIDKFIRSAGNGSSWINEDLDRARKLQIGIYCLNGGLSAITENHSPRTS